MPKIRKTQAHLVTQDHNIEKVDRIVQARGDAGHGLVRNSSRKTTSSDSAGNSVGCRETCNQAEAETELNVHSKI